MASDPHPDARVSAACDLDVSVHGATLEWLRIEDDGGASFRHAGAQSERAGEAPITLEPLTPDDEPFMFAVYSSTRTDELALTGWPASMQEHFLRMQFAAQTYSYRMQFPDAQYSVIHCNGAAAGRLIVNRTDEEIHVVDIAVITEHRGNKIGSRLMGRLLEEAKQAGKTVRLHVERVNPALRWYERLGFKPVSATDIYLEMVYRPNITGAAE
ncbi:MAG: GNAT family N-acetyltransferase [Candidatus Sulfotelmatobacter sp.]